MRVSHWLLSQVSARVSARPLGFTRVLVGIAAVLTSVEVAVRLPSLYEGFPLRTPYVDGISLPPEPWALALAGIGALASVLLLLGWRSRWSAGLTCAVFALVLLADQRLYSNHLYLLVLLTGLLAIADSGAALSLDARRQGGRATIPGYPITLMKVLLAVVYGFAALAKLDPAWLSGGLIALNLRPDGPLAVPETWRTFEVLMPMAVNVVLIETFLALAFFSPRLRRPAVVLGVLLHLGMAAVVIQPLRLAVFALAITAIYPLFFGQPAQVPPTLPARLVTSPDLPGVAPVGGR